MTKLESYKNEKSVKRQMEEAAGVQNEAPKKKFFLKITIVMGLILIIVVVIFLMFNFGGDKGNKSFLESCINSEEIDCNILFQGERIVDECSKIDKDQECFYKAAIAQRNPRICNNISDAQIKGRCEMEVSAYECGSCGGGYEI